MSTVGITIQKNGNLLEANVKVNKKSIMFEKKKLYTHYVSESSNLSIHSTYKIEEILLSDKIQGISATKIRKKLREQGKLK